MMRIPNYMKHPEFFEVFGYDMYHPERRMVPNSKAPKEILREFYVDEVSDGDDNNYLLEDIPELKKRIIEEFKKSKCYQEKSEAERQEIIDYFNAVTYDDVPHFIY